MKKPNLKKWHQEIYDKYNGICQGCKIFFPPEMVCGHHIKTQGSRPDLRLDTNNGILLCNSPSEFNLYNGCHNMVHLGKFIIEQK